jgi:plasmid stabilization system protein ParE
MALRALLRPEARVDLEQAAYWYEDQRQGLGDRFTFEVLGLLQQIGGSPLLFPEVFPPVRRGLLQRFPYAIYFVIEEPAVVILAIVHQRRDPAVWKRRWQDLDEER